MIPTIDLLPFFFKLFFYLLLIVFTLHVSFVGYHWYAYGTNSKLAFTTTALYLILGGTAILIMGTIALT